MIVHSPRHVRTLGDLTDEELDAVATTWHARLAAAREAGFDHPFLLFNEGREAGASLPHSHSQLVWLREAPPEVERELPQLAEGACALCDVLADETLEVAVDGEVSLRVAPAGRAPYEVLLAPRRHQAEPSLEDLGSVLRLIRLAVTRLHALEGWVPWNAWLHYGAHWHFEAMTRLPVLASLELGAGIWVNWLPPEEAVAKLRG